MINLMIVIGFRHKIIEPEARAWAPHLLLNLVLVALVFYHRLQIRAVDRPNFLPLLLNLCAVTLVGLLSVFFLEVIVSLFSHVSLLSHPLVATGLYTLEILAGGSVLTTLLVGFKRLILFEKTRLLVALWRFFEYALVTTIVFSVFGIQFHTFFYKLAYVLVSGLGLVLSLNLKWVGYLDFKQKLQALGILALQLLCLLFFAWFLYYYSSDDHLLFYAQDNILLLVLLSFSLFCTGLSVLVLFFNLPTSSVFEKKLENLNDIKLLQQSFRKQQSEEGLYRLLLESALKAADAQGGWIQLQQENGQEVKVIQSEALPSLALPSLIAAFADQKTKTSLRGQASAKRSSRYYLSAVHHPVYKSVLLTPLRVQDNLSGYLVLLKDVPAGFNKDAVGIARLYAEQTCLAVENLQLLKEAIRVERFQEELAIARRVKESLLPGAEQICCNADCELQVYSASADDVGGDYYDAFRLSEHKMALVVADVSGHGTSAAFTMSQLKGVFHSLVPLHVSCRDFVLQANSALSRGLGRTAFVTLIYGILDSNSRTFTFVRAGHCPLLYYNKQNEQVEALHGKGMGLGLLRSSAYQAHVEEQVLHYQPGDALLLYTDGIIECRNQQQQEYGLERLQEIFRKYAGRAGADPAHYICNSILKDVHQYVGEQEINDDFTTLVVKFS